MKACLAKCPCVWIWFVLFLKDEAYYKGEYYFKKTNLWNCFLFFWDILGVICHLDFTNKKNIWMTSLESWDFSILMKLTMYFANVCTHDTCKCVEEQEIPPCTPLSMVWLSMTLMTLGLTNKDLWWSIDSSLCFLSIT